MKYRRKQPGGKREGEDGMREKIRAFYTAHRKLLSAVPAVLFMIVIFWFSSKTAEKSSESSDRIVDVILGVPGITDQESGEAFAQLRNLVSTIVRKGAHFAEYAVLCALFMYWLCSFCLPYRRLCCTAVLLSACYAATDEFHQLFVEGRSGQVRDVLIDASGALAGMLAISAVRALLRRRKEGRTEEDRA